MTEPQETYARRFAAEWRVANVLPSRWAGEIVLRPGPARRADTREHFQLVFALAGRATFAAGDVSLALEPGTIALLPPEWSHRRAVRGPASFRCVAIQLELTHSSFVPRHPLYGLALPASVMHPEPRRLADFAAQLDGYADDPDQPSRLFATTRVLHDLMSTLLDEGFRAGVLRPAESVPGWVEAVRKMIEDDGYRRGLRIAHLCHRTGRSASSIQHAFRRYYGTTISDYITRRRINLARGLLASNERLTVEAVARRCGYTSRSQFQRQFRKHTGHTPGDTRRPRPA
jgi:AraC-like DNA-binding protein